MPHVIDRTIILRSWGPKIKGQCHRTASWSSTKCLIANCSPRGLQTLSSNVAPNVGLRDSRYGYATELIGKIDSKVEEVRIELYLSDHIQLVADSNRRRLRSSSSMQLAIRRTRLSTVGDRAFPMAGCRIWNSLPSDVTSAPTLTVFRNRLKTHLFSRSFPA